MTKKTYPTTLYVVREHDDHDSWLAAFENAHDVADGRHGEKIAVYKLDHFATAVDKPDLIRGGSR